MARGDSLAGYLTTDRSGAELTDSAGKGLGWRVDTTVTNWRTANGDRVKALRLVKGSGKTQQWAGGLWLGDGGTLFRGIVLGKAPVSFDYEARRELDNDLVAEAEHWLEVDQNAEDDDDDEPDDDAEDPEDDDAGYDDDDDDPDEKHGWDDDDD